MKINSTAARAAFFIGTSVFIAACGGGGSSTSNNNSNSGGGTTPPPPPAPTTYTFRAPITYENNCGDKVAHPLAEVLIHDDDWNIIARQSPGADGMVELTVNEPFLSVSIVTTDRDASHPDIVNGTLPRTNFDIYQSLEMKDYSDTHDFIHYYIPVEPHNAQCECADGNFTVTLPGADYNFVNIDFAGFNGTQTSEQTVESEVTVCKIGDEWPVYSLAAQAPDGVTRVIGVVSNFDELQTSGQQFMNVEHEATQIALPGDLGGFDELRHYNVVNDQPYNWNTNSGDLIEYYVSEREQTNAVVFNTGTFRQSFDGLDVVYQNRTVSTDPFDIAGLVSNYTLPQFTVDNLNQLLETNSFDFRNATDLPFLWFNVLYIGNSSRVSFYYTGDAQGTLPDIDKYTGYEQLFNNLNLVSADLDFSFFDYANITQKTDSAISSAVFSRQPITVDNLNTHYRKDFEVYNLDFDSISVND